jgi:transcriptional regulator of aromatic amino acid metabolism
MLNLRFLSIVDRVQAPKSYNFIAEFNTVLMRLNAVDKPYELEYETRSFFAKAFEIDPATVHVGIFAAAEDPIIEADPDKEKVRQAAIEELFATHITTSSVARRAAQRTEHKEEPTWHADHLSILVRNDLEFDNLQATSPLVGKLLQFLDTVQADLFIPIHDGQQPLGYILVDRQPHSAKILNNVELDQMLVFAEYAASIMTLLRTKNFDALVQSSREMREALTVRQRQIEHFKESIRTLLREQSESMVATASFSDRRLVHCTTNAAKLLEIESLNNPHDSITAELRQLTVKMRQTHQEQSCLITTTSGRQILCTAVADRDEKIATIIMRPHKAALNFDNAFMLIQDPSRWDYILYLETTQSGARIKALLPGSTPLITCLQQDFLKLCLHNRAILITAAAQDTGDFVSLVQNVSNTAKAAHLKLTRPEGEQEAYLKLVGINPLIEPQAEMGLFEQLEYGGLLFIENFEYLSPTTQDILADLLLYGWYIQACSTKKLPCMSRIVFSSSFSLQELVKKELCTAKLAQILHTGTFVMPALASLDALDMQSLVYGYELSEKEAFGIKKEVWLSASQRTRLITQRPTSLRELRQQIQSWLNTRATQPLDLGHLSDEIQQELLTPEVVALLRQGKQVLKDHKSLSTLVQTFKSHIKIARILGVNRSTVYRHCRELNVDVE